ncbi:hypothetical protein Pint_29123 [Pistacia integerrima]|uniref:Uncharacterized protein n=1 Tax=Pistacia integerrima TaxID=434235 RepID=A0ACC0X3U8_9ROSI|nr:hypothetical protein Pint_29123 [Pistacia integerrima]
MKTENDFIGFAYGIRAMGDYDKKDVGTSGLDKKTQNLYSLNPNDNPGNIITQVQLKGENYDEWARVVRTALRAKKKYGFINGTVKELEDNSLKLEDWQRFSIGNGPRVQQLRSDLANCKQDGHAVITYYGRLKALWDELNNYDQILVCTCTGCKCNLTTELERKREEERVHQFLMGLDEEGYGTVRSNILSTEPLPNLNRAYAMVIQQERVRNMIRTREERSSPMSFAVRTGGRNSGGDKDKSVICFNCNREGHDADNCFQLIGYLEWWGNRPRTNVTRRGGGRKRGTGSSRNKPGILLLSSHKNSGNERLTSKGRLLSWIIDSGASYHMTRAYSCLSEVRDIVPCSVGLPNGEETMALKEGTVFLREALILRHDRTLRKLIRAGERHEGVYFFKGVASAHACKAKAVGSSELYAKENGEVNHDEEEAPIADTSAVERNIVEENENVEEPLGRGQRVKQLPPVHLIL